MTLYTNAIDRDLYADLGLGENATAEEIKRAYRQLAHRLHPDVTSDKRAQARFKHVTEAYDVLSDLYTRYEYDLYRWLTNRSRTRPIDPRSAQRLPRPRQPADSESANWYTSLETAFRQAWQRKVEGYVDGWRQTYREYHTAWDQEYQSYVRTWRREYDRWHGNTNIPYHERHDTLTRLSTELTAETQRLELERTAFRQRMQAERKHRIAEYEKELKEALDLLCHRPQWW